MMERRPLSACVLWCVVLVVVFFGLFFALTERRSPRHRTLLSPGDMRLAPPASTLWCEGIDMQAQRPFVAYQVSADPLISAELSSRREFNVTLKSGNTHVLRYFLLPDSAVEVKACSPMSRPRLRLFQGEGGVEACLRRDTESESESDSEEEKSSEEVDDPHCPTLLQSSSAVVGCAVVRWNVSEADVYAVAAEGSTLHVLLRRTRYAVRRAAGGAFRVCSLDRACTIGLSWGSNERAVIWVPDDESAGRTPFPVYTWCRPRLALFAVLSVALPLALFIAASLALRRARRRHQEAESGRVEPLLTTPSDEQPPPYDTLDEPPPSYAELKHGK